MHSGQVSRPPNRYEQTQPSQAPLQAMTLRLSESTELSEQRISATWQEEGEELHDEDLPMLLPHHRRAKWQTQVRENASFRLDGGIDVNMVHVDLPSGVSMAEVWQEAADWLGWEQNCQDSDPRG